MSRKGKEPEQPLLLSSKEGNLPIASNVYEEFRDCRRLYTEVIAGYKDYKEMLDNRRINCGFFGYEYKEEQGEKTFDTLNFDPRTLKILSGKKQPRGGYSVAILSTNDNCIANKALEDTVIKVNANGGYFIVLELGDKLDEQNRQDYWEFLIQHGLTEKSVVQCDNYSPLDKLVLIRGRNRRKAKREGINLDSTRVGYRLRESDRRLKRAADKLGWEADSAEAQKIRNSSRNVPFDSGRIADGFGRTYSHNLSGTIVTISSDGSEFKDFEGIADAEIPDIKAYYPPVPVPNNEELAKSLYPERSLTTVMLSPSQQRRALKKLRIDSFQTKILPEKRYEDGIAKIAVRENIEVIPDISDVSVGQGIELGGRLGVVIKALVPEPGKKGITNLKVMKAVYFIK